MATTSNAVWELKMGVIIAAAELLSGIDLNQMQAVTEVLRTAPPSLHVNPTVQAAHNAPLADQLTLVDEAVSFREAYEALLESQNTGGKS